MTLSQQRRIARRYSRLAMKAAGAAMVIVAILLVGIGGSIELKDAQASVTRNV